MAEHTASIEWVGKGENFLGNKYSRAHTWLFDGGLEVPASASPHIVPQPWSKPEHVDPEEAFIAALASCHMLFFLSIASEHGFEVNRYTDQAVGILTKNSEGKNAITEVTLKPRAVFAAATLPNPAELETMHHSAHEQCFIANSVTTKITIVPA